MKCIAVTGIRASGKTTVCETLIRGLRARGFSVGSVKEIHAGDFAIDKPGSNTDKHRKAGATLVTARGEHETDVMFAQKLPTEEVLSFYKHDYVVLEGVADAGCARIITAHTLEEIDARMGDDVFAVSGMIANTGIKDYMGLPVVNCLDDPDRLTEYAMEHAKRIGGNKMNEPRIEVKADGKQVDMMPFVKKIMHNAVMGVLSELDGVNDPKTIEITIRKD